MTKRLGDHKSANEQRYEYYGDQLAQDAQHGAMRRSKSPEKPTGQKLKFKGLIGSKQDTVKVKNLSEKKALNNYSSEMKIGKKLKHQLRESVGKSILDPRILRNNRGIHKFQTSYLGVPVIKVNPYRPKVKIPHKGTEAKNWKTKPERKSHKPWEVQ